MQESEIRQWCMFMHLSQFAGYAVPFAGLIAPLVMWQMKKDEASEIDRHGREIMNALISFFIYSIVSAILIFVIVGIPMLIALFIASIAFPIIAAIKANEGTFWPYPLVIRFL